MVPSVVAILVFVVVGAALGFPSVVVFLALLVPAGLTYSPCLVLANDQDEHPDQSPAVRWAVEIRRTLYTVLLADAVLFYA